MNRLTFNGSVYEWSSISKFKFRGMPFVVGLTRDGLSCRVADVDGLGQALADHHQKQTDAEYLRTNPERRKPK